jgi:Rieske Fe-S protein
MTASRLGIDCVLGALPLAGCDAGSTVARAFPVDRRTASVIIHATPTAIEPGRPGPPVTAPPASRSVRRRPTMSIDIEPTAAGLGLTRRAVVVGACGAVYAALTACSGDGSGRPAPASPTPAPVTPDPGAAPGGPAAELGASHDIPVGGGRVFPEHMVVVTRPAVDTFKAFTAICTHDRCTLNRVAEGTIDCPCHGSRYAILDGSVVNGPAMRALTPRAITVQGDVIRLSP